MKRIIIGIAATACLGWSAISGAIVVSVDGQDWDVTSVEGAWPDLLSTLDDQPWWGNAASAEHFATSIGDALGTFGFSGPNFAYAPGPIQQNTILTYAYFPPFFAGDLPDVVRWSVDGALDGVSFAVASRFVPLGGTPGGGATEVPEPATLGLLAAGLAAVGVALRRRKAE